MRSAQHASFFHSCLSTVIAVLLFLSFRQSIHLFFVLSLLLYPFTLVRSRTSHHILFFAKQGHITLTLLLTFILLLMYSFLILYINYLSELLIRIVENIGVALSLKELLVNIELCWFLARQCP